MKISQYILLSFFCFIITTLLALFIDSKNAYTLNLNGTPKGYNAVVKNWISPTNLDTFSVIVARSKANILIEYSSKNTISARLFTRDSLFKLPKYYVKKDTLFISESKYKAKTIIKSGNVKSVIAEDGADVYFKNFKGDSLFMELHSSKVHLMDLHKAINFVDIVANNKSDVYLNIRKFNINSVKLNVDNSKITIQGGGQIKNINVILKNKANLYVGKIGKLSMDCDLSSTYNFVSFR